MTAASPLCSASMATSIPWPLKSLGAVGMAEVSRRWWCQIGLERDVIGDSVRLKRGKVGRCATSIRTHIRTHARTHIRTHAHAHAHSLGVELFVDNSSAGQIPATPLPRAISTTRVCYTHMLYVQKKESSSTLASSLAAF